MLALSGQMDVTITHKTGEAFSASVLDKVKNVEGMRPWPARSPGQ